VAYSDTYDCWSVILDDDTKELRVVFYKYARKERIFFDKELERDYEIFEKLGPDDSESGVVNSTDGGKTWIVTYSRSEDPAENFIYDQEKKEIKPLFVSKPELLN